MKEREAYPAGQQQGEHHRTGTVRGKSEVAGAENRFRVVEEKENAGEAEGEERQLVVGGREYAPQG